MIICQLRWRRQFCARPIARLFKSILRQLDSAQQEDAGPDMNRIGFAALGLAACVWTAPAVAAPWMTLASTSMKDGARIPVRLGGDDQKRACSPRNPAICPCPGKNVSPQLAWHNAPAGTKSFAILM